MQFSGEEVCAVLYHVSSAPQKVIILCSFLTCEQTPTMQTALIWCPGLILRAYPPWIRAMMTPIKKNIFPCCILLREKCEVAVQVHSLQLIGHTALSFGFVPCELEALVGQETQRELQTREQEEVAEINQAQHLKLLHSCKDIPTGISVC